VFLDGDCVPHRDYVGDHWHYREPNRFLAGRRVEVSEKIAATLTPENMLQPFAPGKAPRLDRTEFGVAHAYNHYGQMVEYLRMNGIVPPASRGK